MSRSQSGVNRRQFIKTAVAGCVAAGMLDGCSSAPKTPRHTEVSVAPGSKRPIGLVCDPTDPVTSSVPAQWAMVRLEQMLESRGVAVQRFAVHDPEMPVDFCIIAGGSDSAVLSDFPAPGGIALPHAPESLAMYPAKIGSRDYLVAAAADTRGLIYALAELTDRVGHAADARAALRLESPISEKPANRIRSVSRTFASDVEDKGWFNDRAFWQHYFTMLIGHRFNRFNLCLGLGYDFPRGLRDTYFFFAYPFLVNVPGYNVRATPLADEERDRNLQMLRFASDQAAARGLQFQLGIWTHAYQWENSPNANYVIEGLTPQTQAAYSRDALRMILDACPGITGVTLRTHGESGVAEGNYEFWATLFSGIAATGRKLEIDLHAKGMDQKMLDTAVATGLPVAVTPKFWAEHNGLPYMQSSIRQEEMPKDRPNTGFFSLSSGARSFLRYGYGDLLTRDRKYSVIHRIWPGTQRLLLWGDPVYAAEYSRQFSFCGSDGVEIFDPLAFKGRKGSGLKGGRDGYANASLRPAGGDWEKYLYYYRLWGRMMYNPDTEAEVWRRSLRTDFGNAAPGMESALASASRILPLITTAHLPSASNNNYWPEIYVNMSIVDDSKPGSYTDTPRPRNFTAVSSLDPQIFSTPAGLADELLAGHSSGKYSPLDVAAQLEQWGDSARTGLIAGSPSQVTSPAYRRLATDADISAGIGRFFAHKFRAAVLFVIFDRTGYEPAREEALKAYRLARAAWAEMAQGAQGVYAADITFGGEPQLRGNWMDRVPAIDKDIAAMAVIRPAVSAPGLSESKSVAAVAAVLGKAKRAVFQIEHTPPKAFRPGEAIALSFRSGQENISEARLWYRHVNQAEIYASPVMQREGNSFQAAIPAEYTNSPYALQYYFELRRGGEAGIYPGFRQDFLGQPYFVIQQT